MGNTPSRPAFGRTKHVMSEEGKLDAFTNGRYHYNLLDMLHKRRGGGGSSESSSESAGPASSSSVGSKPPASKPAPASIGDSSKPKSGPPIGGTSPSKPKSPVPAPPKSPKLPNLPKLPKPKSGSESPKSGLEPPKNSLPGYTPGQPPYHGSGGHLPANGGQNQGHGKASLPHPCTHPIGMERLRCQKADAVIVTLIAILAIILGPFLIYRCISSYKQSRIKKKNRHVEDGIELTSRTMDCDPSPNIERRVHFDDSNVGLAITTSEETVPIAKVQSRDITSANNLAERSSEVRPPRTRNLSPKRRGSRFNIPRNSLNRGRSRFRRESMDSVASSLSSGMIRTAVLGETFQEINLIDVPPSPGNRRRVLERAVPVEYTDITDGDYTIRHVSSEEESQERVGKNMEDGDIQKEAESRSNSSDRKSGPRGLDYQSDSAVGSPDHSVLKQSVSISKWS